VREITVGFSMMLLCFPLTERYNWKLCRLWQQNGRRCGWCIGPLRISFEREIATR